MVLLFSEPFNTASHRTRSFFKEFLYEAVLIPRTVQTYYEKVYLKTLMTQYQHKYTSLLIQIIRNVIEDNKTDRIIRYDIQK
jgi:recombinational DNA repair protein RecT